jgi:HlyD family secretion protein
MFKYFFILLMSSLCVSCSKPPPKLTNGYIEGRYTYIATSVSGRLMSLDVQRGAPVKSGQILFRLEGQIEKSEEQIAQAGVKQAQNSRDVIVAKLAYAKATYERNKQLIKKNAIQQSLLDQEKSKHDALLAQLAAAEESLSADILKLKQAQWQNQQNNGIAPVAGMVFDIYYRLGEYIPAEHAVLSLLAHEDVKVIFYVNGGELSSLKLGQFVSLLNDGTNEQYKAKIDYISPSAEFTPPVIYSDKTNDKLVYRIEAKLESQNAFQVHPGQPVSINYNSHE